MADTVSIIEDFQQLNVNSLEAMALVTCDLIYFCPDCDPGLSIAHISVDRTWEEIDSFLKTART